MKSLLPCKVTYSQVLGIRLWTSLVGEWGLIAIRFPHPSFLPVNSLLKSTTFPFQPRLMGRKKLFSSVFNSHTLFCTLNPLEISLPKQFYNFLFCSYDKEFSLCGWNLQPFHLCSQSVFLLSGFFHQLFSLDLQFLDPAISKKLFSLILKKKRGLFILDNGEKI